MKGLLLKEYYAVLGSLKRYLYLLVFLVLMGVFLKMPMYTSTMLFVCTIILIFTGYSADEYYKWDEYAVALPVSRKTVIWAKYFFMWILIVVSLLLAMSSAYIMAVTVGTSSKESLAETLVCALVILLVTEAAVPVIIWRGIEQGRMLFLCLALFPIVVMFAGDIVKGMRPLKELFSVTAKYMEKGTWVVIALGITAIISALSCIISVKIYEKKEF